MVLARHIATDSAPCRRARHDSPSFLRHLSGVRAAPCGASGCAHGARPAAGAADVEHATPGQRCAAHLSWLVELAAAAAARAPTRAAVVLMEALPAAVWERVGPLFKCVVAAQRSARERAPEEPFGAQGTNRCGCCN